jgi:hypothetical protein
MNKATTENKKKTWYNKQILVSNNKLKQCGILLKLKLKGKVREKMFFVSAVVMIKVMIIKIFLIPSTIFFFLFFIKLL